MTTMSSQLINTAGYSGLAGLFRGSRNRQTNWGFTQGASNYFLATADGAGDYEVSDAWHQASLETFAWLDDTTDDVSHAEVLRMPRGSTLNYSNGGPTETALAFQSAFDADLFLLPLRTGDTYTFSASTIASNVDLCLQAFTDDGLGLGSATGCSDGASTAALRNATLTVSAYAQHFIVIRAYNVLQAAGAYKVALSNQGDDYPNSPTVGYSAGPIGVTSTMSATATLNGPADADTFRYDRPSDASGDITFTATGMTPPPNLQVFAAFGNAPPSGGAIAIGSGTATVTKPNATRYYVVASSADGATTGAYTVAVTQAACTACNTHGSYDVPTLLPWSTGGAVIDRLDHGVLEPGFDTWAACRNGSACDWFRADLQANQRLTVTTSRVFSSACRLELAVFGPPTMAFFGKPNDWLSPMVFDQGGSMESNGAQLTFVAPSFGSYAIAVRAQASSGCERYELTAAYGWADLTAPPALH